MAFKRTFKLSVFRIENDTVPLRNFYFITNPQNYTLLEKDRISIQKTFGGSYVENFGPDDKTITLSGDFGITTERDGWDGFRDGVKGSVRALKYLREKIIRLGEETIKDGVNFNAYYLKFYDFGNAENYQGGWLVKVDKFEVIRDRSHPLNYRWSIMLTAYGKRLLKIPYTSLQSQINTRLFRPIREVTDVLDINPIDVDISLSNLEESNIDQIISPQNAFRFSQIGQNISIGVWNTRIGLVSEIGVVRNAINRITNSILLAIQAVDSFRLSLVDSAKDIVGIGFDVLENTSILLNGLREVYDNILESGNDFNDISTGFENELDKLENFAFIINEGIKEIEIKTNNNSEMNGSNNMSTPSQISNNSSQKANLVSQAQEMTNRVTIVANKTTDFGGSEIINVPIDRRDTLPSVTLDVTDGNRFEDAFIRVRGSMIKNYASSVSITQIAQQEYGDIELTYLLVNSNPDIINWDNRSGNEDIIIPQLITLDEIALEGNLVYSKDIAGTDLLRDRDNNLVVGSNGDLVLVDNYANIIQAIQTILRTEINTLPTATDFGLGVDNIIGTPSSENELDILTGSISEAILQDPRVINVSSIRIVNNDNVDVLQLNIDIEIADKNRLLRDILIERKDLSNYFSGLVNRL